MTLEESIDEARSLYEQTKRLWEIARTMRDYKESEVQFRAETIRNIIMILSNDSLSVLNKFVNQKQKGE